MDYSLLVFVSLVFLVADWIFVYGKNGGISFDQNYEVIWGGDRVVSLNQGKEIQLSMDNNSGYLISFSLCSFSTLQLLKNMHSHVIGLLFSLLVIEELYFFIPKKNTYIDYWSLNLNHDSILKTFVNLLRTY